MLSAHSRVRERPRASHAMARGSKDGPTVHDRARALASTSIARTNALFGADRAIERGGGSKSAGTAGANGAERAARVRLATKIADEYASVRARGRARTSTVDETRHRRPRRRFWMTAARESRGETRTSAYEEGGKEAQKAPSDIASMIDALDDEDERDGGAQAGRQRRWRRSAEKGVKAEPARLHFRQTRQCRDWGEHCEETGERVAGTGMAGPWKLYRVISGHQGWVRSCVVVDPGNEWFVTGSADRTIKVWDLASGNLKLTLTGHIEQVTGLCVSPRHPYMFSCGLDKKVKCWDLEYTTR